MIQKLLLRHEGIKLKPYLCPAGKITIGVGRNLEDTGITREEAMALLENDIVKFDHDLDIAFSWYKSLSEPRKAVLISMAFNMGMGGLKQFKQMLAALALGDYRRASDQMLASKWASQVGRRAVELSIMMLQNRFVLD